MLGQKWTAESGMETSVVARSYDCRIYQLQIDDEGFDRRARRF